MTACDAVGIIVVEAVSFGKATTGARSIGYRGEDAP
jgi:hypothetical protein